MTGNRGDQMARALWHVGPGRSEIRDEPVGAPRPGELRLRALHSGISRGSEALVFSGRVPDSEHDRMKAPFMGGAFPFPVKYGYANVGRVEAGDTALAGKAVFSLYPHQSHFVLPADAVIALPADVPPQRAVLAANMETALNAVWDAQPGPADRIAVVGAGVVGCLVAWLCGRIPGAQVTLCDIDPSRGPIAKTLGVGFAAPDKAPVDCDLVVHASGTPQGLSAAMALAGNEASILELSWYGAGETPVSLGGSFHSRRLKLISSQVGQVAPSHRPRWTHRRRLEAAISLLSDPALDSLIAPAIRFEDLPQRLPDVLKAGSGILCQRVDYS
ncbi:MAG TPA: zinc-binding alcohol dehydrogenase [Pseudorhodoplanes sp.]|nr:zinc-binding alcohol dehydrogenase [Pseudorhodoplanes sp.]